MDILEAKLSTEHRNDLSESEFGLPKERKFPLNDESHIRSAIMFFKYAKLNQRRELAKNINIKLKKFNMKIKVSNTNPFYKYIDRTYLAESLTHDTNIITETSYTYSVGSNPNEVFDKFICKLINSQNAYKDENIILELENEAYNIIHTTTDNGMNLILFLECINDIFEIIYSDYMKYYNYDNNVKITSLFYCILNDIRKNINNKLIVDDSHNKIDLTKECNLLSNFIDNLIKNNHSVNMYYVLRINSEIFYKASYAATNNVDVITPSLTLYIINPRKFNNIMITNIGNPSEILSDESLKFNSLKTELEDYKKQLEDELYIIKMNNKSNYFNQYNNIQPLYQIDDTDLKDKLDNILKVITYDKLYNIVKNVTFTITPEDQLRINSTKYIDRLFIALLYHYKDLWIGISHNNEIFIITKVIDSIDQIIYKLILVDDACYTWLTNYNISNYKPKIKVITIIFPIISDIDFDIESVTEGLTINEKGDIKITFNPKKSYMEEYSDAHKILVENYKNKNYEAMKHNVAFMFLLISIIERDKRYKDRDPEVVKARAFAINDFKTYLSYIQKTEPSFNFEKYYNESEMDKYIVNIPKETIIGIKNLLKTILL